jgi:4-amino-4-deoxy-L-arabinose transferase-like glycosyltransferase
VVLRLALLAAVAALVLAQGLVAAHVELTFDEAYYALWARWPQAGYFDHPPLVAWTIAASQVLFGRSEFGVRALFWLMGASLPALVYRIGWRLYGDEATAAAAALLFVGAPLFAGAPLATPDAPLVFFWTLALLGLVEAFCGRGWGWGLVGLATGMAVLAKLTAGFLGLGVALALAVTPALRRQARGPGPWASAALAAAVASPFLIWNFAPGFATFLKQGGRIEARAFAPRYLLEFLGAQALLFNPLTAALALFAIARPRGAASAPTRLLLATVAPALGYFALHSLHDRVQGNWPAPLYPALALLAARALRGMRWAPPAAAGLGLAAIAAAYLHLATGWPSLGPSDPLLRIGGWRALSAEVFDAARARESRFVLAEGYAATSLLSFYGPAAPEVAQAGEPERWTFRPPVDVHGRGLAFGRPSFAESLGRQYARVTLLRTLRRRVGGVDLEPYALFAVDGAAP